MAMLSCSDDAPLQGASCPTNYHIIGLFCESSREEPEPPKFLLTQHTLRGSPERRNGGIHGSISLIYGDMHWTSSLQRVMHRDAWGR